MSEKGIIFSTEMVRAILDGRKSQTRRVIKPQPRYGLLLEGYTKDTKGRLCAEFETPIGHESPLMYHPVAPYQVGDIAYVRETWCPVDDTEFGGEFWIDYRATPKYEASHPAGWDNAPDDPDALKWRSPRFMPKKYARIWLEVAGVRAERLWEISVDDCKSEGIKYCDLGNAVQEGYMPQKAFADLWDSTNGKKYPWASNPWVWVYEFKRIK